MLSGRGLYKQGPFPKEGEEFVSTKIFPTFWKKKKKGRFFSGRGGEGKRIRYKIETPTMPRKGKTWKKKPLIAERIGDETEYQGQWGGG